MKQIIFFHKANLSTVVVEAGFDNAVWRSLSSSRPLRQTAVAVPGTFSNFKVKLEVAPGLGKTRRLTIYKNGAATAVTVTITDDGTAAEDTAHSFGVVAGD